MERMDIKSFSSILFKLCFVIENLLNLSYQMIKDLVDITIKFELLIITLDRFYKKVLKYFRLIFLLYNQNHLLKLNNSSQTNCFSGFIHI